MVNLYISIQGYFASIGLSGLFKFFAWVSVFIAPITELLIATGFFIIVDFITGIIKSVKKEGWRSIDSQRMWHTVTKMVLYLLGVVVAFVADKYIVPEPIPLLEIISGFICMTELKSIYENIGETTGINIWKQVVNYVNRQRESK